ncbi:hypothetical protein HZB88_03085 [archaeon]|nr:hypothetical protein [archaeon]
MSLIDFAVAAAIFLTFFVFTFNYVMDYLGRQVDVSRLQEMKTVVLDYFRTLFESKGLPENWEETSITEVGLSQDIYRIPILLNETAGLARTNEPIDVSVTLDGDCGSKAWNSTLRVLDENATEIQSEIYDVVYCSNQFVKEAKLLFLANVSANQVGKYYLYFSPEKNISSANYTTDLNYTTYLENSKVRLNVTGEIAEIYNKTCSINIVGGRAFGIVQYNTLTDTTKQTTNTSGTVTTLVNGKLKKVVQINGSADWFWYKVNVTLYAYVGYFIWDSWINETQAVVVNDFKQPEVNLSIPSAGTIAFRNDTGVYTSTGSSGNTSNVSWLIAYDSSTARDSLAIVVKNYTTWNQSGWNNSGVEYSFSRIQNEYDSGSLSITQYQIFDDNPVYVHPFKSTDPRTMIDGFYNRTKNPLSVTVYPKEKLSVLSVAKLKALRTQGYGEIVRMLGGYDFNIEISE